VRCGRIQENNPVTEIICDRCGTCCRKGGPALHRQDMDLVRSGVIRPAHMVTLRRGEMAYDEARDEVIPLQEELVKLRGAVRGSWTCLFFMPAEIGCRIYNSRPAECRALSCKDTSAILGMYDKDRLTRRDILADNAELLSLVEAHEASCPYAPLAGLGPRLRSDEDAARRLLEAVRLDLSFREVVAERTSVPAEDMDFLFGRPLTETVHRMYGIRVQRRGDDLFLAPAQAV